MKLHRLFAKIFLWFWLAIILVASAAVLAGAWIQAQLNPQSEHVRMLARMTQNVPAHIAVDLLDRSGPQQARDYVDAWRRHSGMDAFLFDEQEHEVSGHQPPPELTSLVGKARRSGGVEIATFGPRMMAAVPVAGQKGRSYVWLGGLPHGPPPMGGAPPPPPMDRAASPPPPPPAPWRFLVDEPLRFGAIILAVIFTGGAVCYWLARYLTRPLESLRGATTRLAEGDLSVRVGQLLRTRRDEIGDLGRDFDRMAERLDAQIATQRRLLRDVSHELRSPLARLNIALGIARQQASPDIALSASQQQCLDRIESESERLNELIGQVLTLARLDSGINMARNEPVQLADVVNRIAEDGQYEAQARRVQVRLVANEPCCLTGDPELLHRAIENVVRNAIHYTAPGSQVEVLLTAHRDEAGSTAVIEVRDHGPGLPDTALEHVLQPFYRVQDGRERTTGGVGLGLAITDRAVRAHHGTVIVANAPGGGLIVKMTLPIKP